MNSFCEFITNPDWWSVIATFVAAIAAAIITGVLGWRQNKLQAQQLKIQEHQNELQEQQVKLQEQQNQLQKHQLALQKQQNAIQCYEIYKNTQQIFASINFFARFLLPDILHFLKHDYRPNGSCQIVREMGNQIEAYEHELQDRTMDVNLHLSHWPIFEYEDLLAEMSFVVEGLEEIIAHNGLIQPQESAEHLMQEDDDFYAETIADYIANEYVEDYKNKLYAFIGVRDAVLSYDASAILQNIYHTHTDELD
jgi:uncharacterized membrane-anchored protein YhcB (DUF1043 family)